MDTVLTAAITTVKTANFLASPATIGVTNPATLTPSWPVARSNVLDLYAPSRFLKLDIASNLNPLKKNRALFIVRCSTRPNTDRNNATDKNSTSDPNSDSEFQKPATPTSSQALSSSNSSFSRGLVFDLGPKNAWDSIEIGSPVVKRYLSDDEERWYMWYHGRSSGDSATDSIGLAVSGNGVHWERGGRPVRSSGDVGLVVNCSKDWWAFDTQSIRPSEVVIMSSSKVRANNAVYWLYYTGFGSETVDVSLDNCMGFDLQNPERAWIDVDESGENGRSSKVYKSLPGLAMSQDGRHWARIEGEHHSGALFDVGSKGEWDSMFIAAPQVVFHGTGDLRMYYHSFDAENGHYAIGIARSRDGIRWVKLGKIIGRGANGAFDEFGAMNACVVRSRKDGKYVMVYGGVAADGKRSIGLAMSVDGLKNWQRIHDGMVLQPSEADGWDNKGVGSPYLVQMDGDANEWRLYYKGISKGGRTGIGMAVSAGKDIRSFTRWTGFHL